MHFDFVDIGTSDFETSLDLRTNNQTVLLVEPLFSYLANLANGEGIFKAPFAVSNQAGFNKIYYVEESDIQTNNLPAWVKGCNSIGEKHITVTKLLNERGLPVILIKSQSIRLITFKQLVEIYAITSIGQLKIDTEGHDHFILPDVIQLLKSKKLRIKSIIIEYIEVFGNTVTLDQHIAILLRLGYTRAQLGDNVTLTLS